MSFAPFAIHLFRRDLRLSDNTALLAALSSGLPVLALFCLDPRQVDAQKNSYFSPPAFAFLKDSLVSLNKELKNFGSGLMVAHGHPEEVLSKIKKSFPLSAVFFNKDYTPFALSRDARIELALATVGVPVFSFDDALLNPPGTIKKDNGELYSMFTPFYKKSLSVNVASPKSLPAELNFVQGEIVADFLQDVGSAFDRFEPFFSLGENFVGGRRSGQKLLQSFLDKDGYSEKRNFPALPATSLLSAHHKFGTLSIRETYAAARSSSRELSGFIMELYWRDFFTTLAYYYPRVFGAAFRVNFDKIKWENNQSNLLAWQEGRTGFPIVDAGMRELNSTGFMHNRVRMITASFLVKNLGEDWRLGERYFASHLVDYDPAVNNGNWQWVAGTGADAAPYFRVFNPVLQGKKFDPEGVYIRKWLPELGSVSTKDIFKLGLENSPSVDGYPSPLVDLSSSVKRAKRRYQVAAG